MCEDKFLKGVKQNSSGRFMVKLPFERNIHILGESYDIARKRFLLMEYSKFLDKYSDLGHLETVPQNEMAEIQYWIPHHPVLRPDSSTTKLRVVFDASYKTSSGYSLNDNLLVRPRLQLELLDILIRFRFYKFALNADISKMYRQMLIESEDCN